MDIKEAKYEKAGNAEVNSIVVTLNSGGVLVVPLVEGNTEYDEIMKQVKAGTLTIKDAD